MPPQECMPERPTAVIVAQQGRHSWALEEAWDLAVSLDPDGGKVIETGFQGVFLVYASSSGPRDVSVAASRMEMGFISRVVPVVHCLQASTRDDVEEALEMVARGLEGPVRIIVSIRGVGKKIGGRSMVESVLRRVGLHLRKNSKYVIAVESIGDMFIISHGIMRRCGLGCIIVYFKG